MPRRQPTLKRLSTAARWPVGIALTSWRYMWRTTPLHRRELVGWLPEDAPPALPPHLDDEDIQAPEDGAGPLVRRLYRTRIRGPQVSPEQLMERITANLDCIAPTELASFQRIGGEGRLAMGDKYIVRIPGPWDHPVRVTVVTDRGARARRPAGAGIRLGLRDPRGPLRAGPDPL